MRVLLGALPFLLVPLVLGFAPAPYERAGWRHWVQTEGCQTVRTAVLRRESREPVAWRDQTRCEVAWGKWIDPYDGAEINDPLKIDVDHVVPLRWAHENGAAGWPAERKQAFANDLGYRGHLAITSLRLNRQKGAKGPAEWEPPMKDRLCGYAHRWAAILVVWDLHPPERDRLALRRMLGECKEVLP